MSRRGRSLAISFVPAVLLLAGAGGRAVLHPDRSLPLREPLEQVGRALAPYGPSRAVPIPPAEERILAADDLLFRRYRLADGRPADLFVAFYGRQRSGSSIHSPRNCLPGSGWEPVAHSVRTVDTDRGPGRVNEYVVENGDGRRAVVYYWYQGRGRMVADEFRVKWYLLEDAVLRRRTDESLVRLVVPLRSGEAGAGVPEEGAELGMVRSTADAMWRALPASPGSGE